MIPKSVVGSWKAKARVIFVFAARFAIATPARSQDNDKDQPKTATPIKHVILIIGETRIFDNIYATYIPMHGTVSNLLSKGIIHADGSPGPHADLAQQFQLQTINPVSYFIDTRKLINPARGDDSGSNSMGFYNVQRGDAPLFKRLADAPNTFYMINNTRSGFLSKGQLTWPCIGPKWMSRSWRRGRFR